LITFSNFIAINTGPHGAWHGTVGQLLSGALDWPGAERAGNMEILF
jgi:hypothetical protein